MTASPPTSRPQTGWPERIGYVLGVALMLGVIGLVISLVTASLPSPLYATQTVGKHWTVPAEARGFGCRSWEDVQAIRREIGIGKDSSIKLLGDKMVAGQCVHLKSGMSVLITETALDRFRFRTSSSGMTEFWASKLN